MEEKIRKFVESEMILPDSVNGIELTIKSVIAFIEREFSPKAASETSAEQAQTENV